MGCDAQHAKIKRLTEVSIHAPAWGATASEKCAVQVNVGFNPRTRMGCDLSSSFHSQSVFMFQSTHPHGVRHFTLAAGRLYICFNPRTRMGCDQMMSAQTDYYTVSIHAPAWGATSSALSILWLLPCFNPRTRMGCD